METESNQRARVLFNGVAKRYDLLTEVLSLWQNRRWRRFLVSQLHAEPGQKVLDLCTGTASVAIHIAKTHEARVIGVDLSENMLEQGRLNVQRHGLEDRVALVLGRAEQLDFPDGYFDAVAFTYLLRYVDDVAATVAEVARVLKPGGTMASLEFAVPERTIFRGPWLLYTRAILPLVTKVISPGWSEVGSFLGPSISRFYANTPTEQLHRIWRSAGIGHVNTRFMSLGGGMVMWGTKDGGASVFE